MYYDSENRQDMVPGTEIGDFLMGKMRLDGVACYLDNLDYRNQVTIETMKVHNIPEEEVMQAEETAADGGRNAIQTMIEEIRLSGDYRVIPAWVLDLFFKVAGPYATALFAQLCQEEYERTEESGGKDYREKPWRP